MPVANAEIATLFNRYADLLEIEDANPFRVRAYRNAARTIGGYSRSIAQLVSEGHDLGELPSIGKDLAAAATPRTSCAGRLAAGPDTGVRPRDGPRYRHLHDF